MAREMNKKARPFRLADSDAIEENERILEAGSQQRKENREAEQTNTAPTSAPVAQEMAHTDMPTDTPTDTFAANVKKTANGIVVNVPMEDYMQLTMMKFQTGRTLKDLALQAIHEFVERKK